MAQPCDRILLGPFAVGESRARSGESCRGSPAVSGGVRARSSGGEFSRDADAARFRNHRAYESCTCRALGDARPSTNRVCAGHVESARSGISFDVSSADRSDRATRPLERAGHVETTQRVWLSAHRRLNPAEPARRSLDGARRQLERYLEPSRHTGGCPRRSEGSAAESMRPGSAAAWRPMGYRDIHRD